MKQTNRQHTNKQHKPPVMTSKWTVLILGIVSIIVSISLFFSKPRSFHEITIPSIDVKTTRKLNSDNSFNVPADMWKNPEDDPSWNPIDLPVCCCKSRQPTFRYIGPGAGLTPDDLRMALKQQKGDVILIGDSVMMQWFFQLKCYLGAESSNFRNAQFKGRDFEKEILGLLQKDIKWNRRNIGMTSGRSSFSYFDIPSMDEKMITEQRIINHSTNTLSAEEIVGLLFFYDRVYSREYGRERPLFLLNAGMHFMEHKNAASLRETFKKMYNSCREGGMKCIFRETTPQHFQNPDGNGLYTKSPIWNRKACSEPPKSFQELSGWRNDLLRSVVSETDELINAEGKGFVRIMPLFDRLAFLSFAHPEVKYEAGKLKIDCYSCLQWGKKIKPRGKRPPNDCTHFAVRPEYWEPWHVSLTQTLDDLHKEVSTI